MIEGNCYYCDKPVNNLAGNPNEWGIPLCHEDEPGKVKTHHIGCVSERLRENKKMKKALAWADEELSRLKTGKESQLVEEITKLQEEKKKFDKIYEEEMKTVGGILNDNEELQKKNEALTDLICSCIKNDKILIPKKIKSYEKCYEEYIVYKLKEYK